MSVHYQQLPKYNTSVRTHLNSSLGWNTNASIKHTCPENARRIPSLPCKSNNRVLYSFQSYEKLHSTWWAAKARCIPTFLGLKFLILFWMVCTIYVLTQGITYLSKYSRKAETVCIPSNNSK